MPKPAKVQSTLLGGKGTVLLRCVCVGKQSAVRLERRFKRTGSSKPWDGVCREGARGHAAAEPKAGRHAGLGAGQGRRAAPRSSTARGCAGGAEPSESAVLGRGGRAGGATPPTAVSCGSCRRCR